jgi:(S)-2-hydroxyglutarate dehydrogenase
MSEKVDVAIVGAGIVGLATALTLLQQRPNARVTVIDKEPEVGQHQTGHNSGVIHSGVYYRPGSAKARMCLRGRQLLIDYCGAKGIPVQRTGKLVVATEAAELPALDAIRERAIQNEVSGVTPLGPEQIRESEPEVRGLRALDVPTTSIVDYRQVVRAMAADIAERGGSVMLTSHLSSIERDGPSVLTRTSNEDVRSGFLVNCAGLHSDRIARLAGMKPSVQIIPFRGEFYNIRPSRALELHRLIYPVPNPALPFLGVHLTLTMRGTITAGPNAVLAGGREAYSRFGLTGVDTAEMITFPGFWRMSRQFWQVGLYEQFRSLSRRQYATDLQKFVPNLSPDDLESGTSGIRAQAVDIHGTLMDDFVFESGPSSLHVLNAPSPAATSSLAIAEEIVRKVPTLP